jgi:hypothetical protein
MDSIRFFTPDGRQLRVRRDGHLWFVRCGVSEAESVNLDVAMIDALRGASSLDVEAHAASNIEMGAWVRERARAIEDLLNLDT